VIRGDDAEDLSFFSDADKASLGMGRYASESREVFIRLVGETLQFGRAQQDGSGSSDNGNLAVSEGSTEQGLVHTRRDVLPRAAVVLGFQDPSGDSIDQDPIGRQDAHSKEGALATTQIDLLPRLATVACSDKGAELSDEEPFPFVDEAEAAVDVVQARGEFFQFFPPSVVLSRVS